MFILYCQNYLKVLILSLKDIKNIEHMIRWYIFLMIEK